ncbi:MAG TPA: FecR domain-containing protein, partial [Blastocatellia bacterium]|nr:FecR domain-containing protein [Blastocatellia bacterium]
MQKKKLTNILFILAMLLTPITLLARTPANSAVPIGSIESLEPFLINGTPSGQQSLLWNGDVIRAAAGASAQVLLSAIGKVTLRGGATVRLTTDATTQTLRADVLQGEVNVVLKPESSAQLELSGKTFVSTKGAQFRAAVRDGQPVVSVAEGKVVSLGNFGLLSAAEAALAAQQQTAPRRYIIKPLNLGTNTEIRARSTRNLQVQVTDENDRPVPDAPVLFLLGGGSGSSNAGTLAGQTSLRVTTNSQGIANVNFTASDTVGSSTRIEARVEGSDAVWQGTLNVVRAAAGFWAPQNAVPVF